jgi:hypothetical protein
MCERYLRHTPHIVASSSHLEGLLEMACEATFMINKVIKDFFKKLFLEKSLLRVNFWGYTRFE